MFTPFTKAASITPANDTLHGKPCRAIYVGGAGNLAVKMSLNDSAVTLTGVPAGTVLNIAPACVMSTNTTATAIVALW